MRGLRSCSLVSVIVVRSFPSARLDSSGPARRRRRHHAAAKARQPLRVLQQPSRQPTRRHGDVHQTLAAQSRAQLGTRECRDQRQIRRQPAQLAPPVGRPSLPPPRPPPSPSATRARTCSKPAATCPARRASPSVASATARQQTLDLLGRDLRQLAPALAPPSQRGSWRRPCLPHSDRRSTTYRAPAGAPRRRAATRPSGSSTKRSSASRGRTARVTRQRRSAGVGRSPIGVAPPPSAPAQPAPLGRVRRAVAGRRPSASPAASRRGRCRLGRTSGRARP